jgi:hypothetical protein
MRACPCQREGERPPGREYEPPQASKGMRVRIWSRAPEKAERLSPFAAGALRLLLVARSGQVPVGIRFCEKIQVIVRARHEMRIRP